MAPESTTDGGSPEMDLSLDMALEILSQYQRREIIRYLGDADGRVHSLDRLIDHLADLERKRGGPVPGDDYFLSVLVHVHGPKLEEAGVLTYDVSDREIRYDANEKVERLLEQIETVEADW